MLQLTADNYYGPEAAGAYFSASQIKQFMTCEAMALAELRGEYERKKTPALLVGGYIDAHFAGEAEQFAEENPEIFTKTGALRSEYRQAEEIIARIEREPLAMALMEGEKQKIVTGEIAGYPFRAKLDVWLSAEQARSIAQRFPKMQEMADADGAIIDLKIMKDFEAMYRRDEGRMSFVEYWRYDLQLAIYQKLMESQGKKIPCYILAASKQDPPDLCLVRLEQDMLDFCLEELTKCVDHYAAVRSGEEEPEACGRCAHCRASKTLTGPTTTEVLLWA